LPGFQSFDKTSTIIPAMSFTQFIALAERGGEVTLRIHYPMERCKLNIYGLGEFEEEVKTAQKEHDLENDDEFHHLFHKFYGNESVLWFALNCTPPTARIGTQLKKR
jgi:hypothetical protein